MSQADKSDLTSMTVAQIKDELTKQGLPITGKKAELITRLKSTLPSDGTETTESTELQAGEEEDENATGGEEEGEEENAEEVTLDDDGEDENLDGVNDDDLLDQDDPGMEDDQEVNVSETQDDTQANDNEVSLNDVETTSLDVDLDPSDIATVGDLDENKEGAVTEVAVDTVGEIDDAEFDQGVIAMETDAKPPQTEKKREKKEKILEPAPPGSLMNWYLGRFSSCKRFCSVYFSIRQPTDMLRPEVQEWAKKAARFIINQNYEGQGSAVFDFRTEQEGIDCKDAILALLGSEITIIHPSRSTENQVVEGTSYRPQDYSSYNRRTCIVEGFPESTKSEDLRTLFSEAVMVAKPLIPSKIYRWRNQDYNLPVGTESQFLVEFLTGKAAERAVDEHKEFLVDGNQIKVQLVDTYISGYRSVWSKKQEEIKEQRRKEDEIIREKRAKETLPDKERLDLCQELSNTMKERQRINRQSNMPWAAKLSITDKLSKKVLDIVRMLDADTDKRKLQGKAFPESSHLMTKHTRFVAGEETKDKDIKDKEADPQQKDDETGKLDDRERVRLARQLKLTREQKLALNDDNSLPWNQKMMTMDKLEKKMKTLIFKIDTDTKLRLGSGAGVPEPMPHMTKYTRQMLPRLKRGKDSIESGSEQASKEGAKSESSKEKSPKVKEEPKEKSDSKDKPDNEISSSTEKASTRKDEKKESAKASETKDDKVKKESKERDVKSKEKEKRRSRSPVPPIDRATQRAMDQEIRKLEPDNRNWWSISASMHKDLVKRENARDIFGKFGTIMEIHYTKTKLFIRFNGRGAAIRAMRHFYSKYGIRVPEINPQYRINKTGPPSREPPLSPRGRGRPARRSEEPLMHDVGFSPQAQPQILAMQQQQQQQQQQMMYQQRLMQQQQLAAQEQSMRPMGSLLGEPQIAMPSAYDGNRGGVKRFQSRPVDDVSPALKRRRSLSPVNQGRTPQGYYGASAGDGRQRDYFDDRRHGRVESASHSRPEEKSSDPSAIANVLKGLTQVISSKMELLSRSGPNQQAGKQAIKEVMDTLGHATHSLGHPGSRQHKETVNRSGGGLLPAPGAGERDYNINIPEKQYPKPVPPVQYPDPYAYEDMSRRNYSSREGQMGYGGEYSGQGLDRPRDYPRY